VRSRRTVVACLLVLVAVLLAWWLLRDGAVEPAAPEVVTAAPVPGPSGTRRARVVRQRAAAPPPVDDDDDDDDEPYRLSVTLGDPAVRIREWLDDRILLRPDHFWPALDEAPLPDGEASRLYQELLDHASLPKAERTFSGAEHRARRRRFVELATAEGLTVEQADPDGDPWAGLLALARERQARLLRYREAWDAWRQDPQGGRPRIDYAPMAQLARAIVETHPDDAVSDYAALYLLDAVKDHRSVLASPDEATEVARWLLATSSDRLVRDNAVTMLALIHPMHMPDDGALELIRRELAGTAEPAVALSLVEFQVDAAFHRGDHERASGLLDELERRGEELCTRRPAHRACAVLEMEIATSRGQLRALRGEGPEGWREAITAAAWRCHEREPLDLPEEVRRKAVDMQVAMRALGRRAGNGWTWSGWEPGRDDFTACLERESAELPPPPEPRDVALEVYRWQAPDEPAWGR